MQSPISTYTFNNFVIRADSLNKNNQNKNKDNKENKKNSCSINHSFERVLDNFNIKPEVDDEKNFKYIQPKNIVEFLGDSDDSTEISSIVFNLNTISNSCRKPERENLNLDIDDSKSEILQILKFKERANTSTNPLRPIRINDSQKNICKFEGNINYKFLSNGNGENKVKKISLAGKILKIKDTEKPEIRISNFDKIPERLKNPIKLNNDF